MEKRIDYEIEKEMDRAIIFLSKAISKSGNNEKPVILHSIRVGLELFNHGYSRDIVISGILHDVIEDTKESEKNILENFGEKVFDIVVANTFDKCIMNKRKQNIVMFKNCKEYGREALIVKCADILDNIDFFPLAKTKEIKNMLINKYMDFLKSAQELEKELIFIKLSDKVKSIKNNIV